jgi:hypothetical protein
LGYNDLWFDEARSLNSSLDITRSIIQERQAPLYYFLLSKWITFSGYSEYSLRLFSAIFSILGILFIYILGIYIYDKNAALFSSLILSISPMHIWYAQEARKYALFTFIVLVNTYYFLRAVKENKNIFWLVYAFFLILGFYADYFTFLLLLVQGLFLICLGEFRSQVKRWLSYVAVSLILFLPWLPILIQQVQGISQSFWVPAPSFRDLLITLENFNLGYNANHQSYQLSNIFFLPFFFLGLYASKKNRLSYLIYFLFFSPLIISFLISITIVPVYLDRLFVPFSAFYYLFLGYGLVRLKPLIRFICLIPIFILISLSLNNYFINYMPSDLSHHQGTYIKKPVRPLVEFLMDNYQETDLVAPTHPSAFCLVEGYSEFFYHFKFKNIYYLILPENQDSYWRHVIMNLSTSKYYIDMEKEGHRLKFNRVWLISSSWPRDGTLDENSVAVREWMEKNYKRTSERWFDGILVGLYEKDEN